MPLDGRAQERALTALTGRPRPKAASVSLEFAEALDPWTRRWMSSKALCAPS